MVMLAVALGAPSSRPARLAPWATTPPPRSELSKRAERVPTMASWPGAEARAAASVVPPACARAIAGDRRDARATATDHRETRFTIDMATLPRSTCGSRDVTRLRPEQKAPWGSRPGGARQVEGGGTAHATLRGEACQTC